MNPDNYVRNGEAVGPMKGAASVLMANEAIEWLKNRDDKERPFFITLWTAEPHAPVETVPKYMEPYSHINNEDIRQYNGNITQLDDAFGILMKAIDGVNMLPALKGGELEREQPLYWRTHVSNLDCRVALREGDWKIVADYKMKEFLLFNLADDYKEEHDLSDRHPERFADLREKLIAHDRTVRTEGGTLDVPERVK